MTHLRSGMIARVLPASGAEGLVSIQAEDGRAAIVEDACHRFFQVDVQHLVPLADQREGINQFRNARRDRVGLQGHPVLPASAYERAE